MRAQSFEFGGGSTGHTANRSEFIGRFRRRRPKGTLYLLCRRLSQFPSSRKSGPLLEEPRIGTPEPLNWVRRPRCRTYAVILCLFKRSSSDHLFINSPVLEQELEETGMGMGTGQRRQKTDRQRGSNLTCNSSRGNNRLRNNGHHENKSCDSHPSSRCDRCRDIHSGSCRGTNYDKTRNYFQRSG